LNGPLTKEHLLYNSNNKLVRAYSLKIGDIVNGKNRKIINIEFVYDIPLTPCIVEGVMDIQGKMISCWSHNEENAKKMEALCGQIRSAFAMNISVETISKMAHNVYKKYHKSGKDLSIMHKESNKEKLDWQKTSIIPVY